MSRRRAGAALLAATALPAVAACLCACGSGSASTTTPGTRADAVCAAYNAQINAVSPAPTVDPGTITDASSLEITAVWLDDITPLALREQQALAGAPDGAPIVAPFNEQITTLHGADAAAKGTDVAAFRTAWASFIAAQTAFQSAAAAASMPNCAK